MKAVVSTLAIALTLSLASTAHARGSYLDSAVAAYPGIEGTRLESCSLCHTSVPGRNSYGRDWDDAGGSFSAIAGDDSDGDGFLNLAEIDALTFPGDATDVPSSSDPTLCGALADRIAALTDFRMAFGVATTDLGGLGLPEGAALALVQDAACGASSSVATATQAAFDINLAFLLNSTFPSGLEGHEGILAALLLASTEVQTVVVGILQNAGVTLDTTNFEVVTCDGAGCLPTAPKADGEFFTADEAMKQASDEPYAANGDFDGDGTTNVTEFENVDTRGGSTADFVDAATDAGSDGTASSGGGCAAGASPDGTSAEWPVLVAFLAVGLFLSGRSSARR